MTEANILLQLSKVVHLHAVINSQSLMQAIFVLSIQQRKTSFVMLQYNPTAIGSFKSEVDDVTPPQKKS